MKRILIADAYYPEVIKALPVGNGSFEEELRKILNFSFGTADFYSRNLRAIGWDAQDIIVNHQPLMTLWHFQVGGLKSLKPDVVFLQDLSIPLEYKPKILAAQCSCPWPGDGAVKRCDVVFTSFPHYVPRIAALGVKAVYNPLGFDPIVLERMDRPNMRPLNCTFVGGVGAPSHWQYGMKVLEAISSSITDFQWWGYGLDTLPSNSSLRGNYRGPAWGLDMYSVFCRSKIVVNRHGEVAGSFANNMRMFEATGCGALLVTEAKDNIADFFAPDEVVTYRSPQEAVEKVKYYLEHETERQSIANKGRGRTLSDHTYAKRMKTVSDTLKGML